MSQERKLKRVQEKKAEKEAEGPQGVDHRHLPVGKIVTSPIKGDFLTIPMLGWIAIRAKVNTPLVMIAALLFRSVEDPKPRGTIHIELPVFDETLQATVAALERYGWDGRAWPEDEGWPSVEGESGPNEDEKNLLNMIEAVELKATLTFPPNDKGNAAQAVSVQRARGPFLMPPLPEPDEPPNPDLVKRLEELCKKPGIFYRQGKH